MSVSYGGDSIVFADGSVQSGGWTGMRNRIINGAMVIDQRNAGVVSTPASGTYTLDRWLIYQSVASKFSVQQNAGAVTPPVGFGNYLGATSLSSYAVLSGDYYLIQQMIEGFNTADLAWGTANAATVTLSFWVRSSLTGTFGGVLNNSAGNRSYPFTFTISTANTWEQKTITVAGDTSGTWIGATNGIGLMVRFGLGIGTTYSGTAGAWAGATYFSATGATSVVGTNGATFYITGVQLERGSTASSFEYRPIGTELVLCQRYCQVNGGAEATQLLSISWAYSTTAAITACLLPVPMRATPSLSYSAVGDWAVFNGGAGGPYTCTSIALNRASPTSLALEFVASTLTAGQAGAVLANNTTNAKLILSAEL